MNSLNLTVRYLSVFVSTTLSLVMAGGLRAQTPTTPAASAANPAGTLSSAAGRTGATQAQAAIDLPRLKSKGKPGEMTPLARSKVTVDNLAPRSATGARLAVKQDVVYLTLESGREWARPLRGSASDTTFVSFLAYGSVGTTIDIGGARLSLQPSTKTGYAKLVVGESGATAAPAPGFADLIKLEQHEGVPLAALPVLTVRLDPVAKVWDLFVFQRLVVEDIPLAEVKGARQFSLHPGAQGAWMLSLVTSDENPLFVDANANGIDDAFEKTKRQGALLLLGN